MIISSVTRASNSYDAASQLRPCAVHFQFGAIRPIRIIAASLFVLTATQAIAGGDGGHGAGHASDSAAGNGWSAGQLGVIAGGDGGDSISGIAGGSGGEAGDPNGREGSGDLMYAGGGGGGATGIVIENPVQLDAGLVISGGHGGAGGVTVGMFAENMGGGGGGGAGAVISADVVSAARIRGGDGGFGQMGGSSGGGGGGGAGVILNGTGLSFTNHGWIEGGQAGAGIVYLLGGQGGMGEGNASGAKRDGSPAQAGAAIVGHPGAGAVTVINNGTVKSGDAFAAAIVLSGDGNVLEIWSESDIHGRVDAGAGNNNVFRLGGSVDAGFDVAKLGAYGQYVGFDTFEKVGDAVWSLTGTAAEPINWTVRQGALAVRDQAALGQSVNTITLNGGMLRIEGSTIHTLANPVIMHGVGAGLDIADADHRLVFDQSLSNVASFRKEGPGSLVMTGDNSTYTGSTSVRAGTLSVGLNGIGALGGSVHVSAGAVLTGSGTVGGAGVATTIADGGILAPGNSLGSLSVAGDLVLEDGAVSHFELGSAALSRDGGGRSDHVRVGGDLRLGGSLLLHAGSDAADGAPGLGYYRLFSYGGQLSGPGLAILDSPSMPSAGVMQVLLDTPHHVDLYISGSGVQHWAGGDGVWNAVDGWQSDGGATTSWAGHTAVFGKPDNQTQGGVIEIQGDVAAYSLQFVQDGYSLLGDGRLALDSNTGKPAEVRVLTSVSANVGVAITGGSGLNKTHGGTLTLSGVNTYQGGTTISDGVLQISHDANLGAFLTDQDRTVVLDGGTLSYQVQADETSQFSLNRNLNVTQSSTLSVNINTGSSDSSCSCSGGVLKVNGNVSGTSTVTVTGNSKVVLTSTSTHSGTMHIQNEGGVQIGDGGTTGELSSNVVNDTILAFDRFDDVSYPGQLSGAGTLVQAGVGMLMLTGDSGDYQGNTIVQSGVLELADGAALGGDVDVQESGFLRGSGRLGAADRTVSIQDGATLLAASETGNLLIAGDLAVHPGATLIAANPTDALVVEGDLELHRGAVLQVQLAGEEPTLEVAGQARLNGELRIQNEPEGIEVDAPYAVVLAADLDVGDDFDVQDRYEYLAPQFSYDEKSLLVTFNRKNGRNDDTWFRTAAETANEAAVADAIESLSDGHALYRQIAGLPKGSAPNVFRALSGEIHAGGGSAMSAFAQELARRSLARLRCRMARPLKQEHAKDETGRLPSVPTCREEQLWAEAIVARQTWPGGDGAAGMDGRTQSLLIGADARLGSDWRFTGSIGYVDGSLHADTLLSRARTDSYAIGANVGRTYDMSGGLLKFGAGLSYTWHKIKTNRVANVNTVAQTLRASYHARSVQMAAELAYERQLSDGLRMEPYVAVLSQVRSIDGFKEQGGNMALRAQAGRSHASSIELGMRAYHELQRTDGQANVYAQLGWRRHIGALDNTANLSFDGSRSFQIHGPHATRDLAVFELGTNWTAWENTSVSAAYSGNWGWRYREHAGQIKVQYQF